MTEIVSIGLYRHALPPKCPTLLQLALRLLRRSREYTRAESGVLTLASWEMDGLEADQLEAADAFFAALEAETGISREMVRDLGGLA